MIPDLLPPWFVALLAFIAGIECIGLSLYLIRSKDHLIMHSADLGIVGGFSLLVALHYSLILLSPDYARSVAFSRIAWSLFFGANVIIMTRYILAVMKYNATAQHNSHVEMNLARSAEYEDGA